MRLDRVAMEQIRQEFIKHHMSVDIYDFVDIVQRYEYVVNPSVINVS